jgi:hypothetical protein
LVVVAVGAFVVVGADVGALVGALVVVEGAFVVGGLVVVGAAVGAFVVVGVAVVVVVGAPVEGGGLPLYTVYFCSDPSFMNTEIITADGFGICTEAPFLYHGTFHSAGAGANGTF